MLNSLLSLIAALGDYTRMILDVIWLSIKRPPSWSLLKVQLFNIGVLSLPVVMFTGFSTGMVMAAQAYFQLSDKGLASGTGLMVGKAMIVELGPVLTAFMVTGRVGSAMCAELGSMHVTEQIDAMQSMAVNPLRYLVAPRFFAGILMLPLLSIFSSITGVIGGFIIAVYFYHMPATSFLDPLPIHINNFDIFSGLAKSFVFGFIIVSVSCYLGMKTRGGAAGVGSATTRSVVICYSLILLSNFIVTLGLNNSYYWMADIFEAWF
jgi:phospholipid/cholesterol/gamma-HCH transport system permease protein